jgi:hypothetical protein
MERDNAKIFIANPGRPSSLSSFRVQCYYLLARRKLAQRKLRLRQLQKYRPKQSGVQTLKEPPVREIWFRLSCWWYGYNPVRVREILDADAKPPEASFNKEKNLASRRLNGHSSAAVRVILR